jgi:GNT-I family
MSHAPIILFVYNRPDLTRQTLESLSRNAEASKSRLFVFSDGPKPNATDAQKEKIEQVRAVINSRNWCAETTLIAAETNKGLANSVIAGVTKITQEFGKAIIVEDDVTVSPYFLQFMNESLTYYENDDKVASVGGWNYYCPPEKIGDNFFLRHPDTIAWATWARAWELFNPDTDYLIHAIKKQGLGKYLNMENTINLVRMLRKQKAGKVDSWAVRWTASLVLNQKLSLYPQFPLTRHEGFAEGTHFSAHQSAEEKPLELAQHPLSINPILVAENPLAVRFYIEHHKKSNSIWQRGLATLRRIFK